MAHALPVPLSFQHLRLTSLLLGGELEYEFEKFSERTQSDFLALNVRSGARGYYWQPWLATWNADIDLQMLQDQIVLGEDASNEISSLGIGGGVSLFAASRFPTSISLRYTEDYDGGLIVDGTRRNSTLFFDLNSNYQRLPGETYSGNFTHRIDNASGNGGEDSFTNILRLTADKRLSPTQDVKGTFDLFHEETDATEQQDLDLILTARHDYRPSLSFQSFSFASVTQTHDSSPQGNPSDSGIYTVNGGLNWRPAWDRRLDVRSNATLTHIDTSAGTSTGSFETSQDLASWSANAMYRYNPKTDFIADSFISHARSDSADTTFSSQSLRALYSGDSRELMGFIHNWRGSAAVRYEHESQSDPSDEGFLGGSLRQGFSRSVMLAPLSLVVRHSSGFQAEAGSVGGTESDLDLFTAGTVAWQRTLGPATYTSTLDVEDDRTYILTERDGESEADTAFQRMRLNLGLTRQFPWGASTTLNYYLDASRDEISGQNDRSASLNVTYTDRSFIGVPRLGYTSRLFMLARDEIYVTFGSGEDQTLTWDNDFNYRIGRLELSLELDWSRFEDETSYRVFFNAKRRFGVI